MRAEAFARRPYFAEAVRLRRWDDAAKVVELETPSLAHFLFHVRRVAQAAPL